MARPAARIVLSEEERKQLEAMRTKPRAENRYAERARIILSAAQGCSNKEIARALNTREARVSKWRVRFEREGLSGLHDDFRAGRPLEVVENFRELLLTRLDEDPPERVCPLEWHIAGQEPGGERGSGMEGIAASGHQSATATQLVCVNRSAVFAKSGRCDWSLLESSR